MSESKRIVGPITTEFGTFQPGDKAIAITMNTSTLKVARVEYVGYIEREEYNWRTKKSEAKKFAQIRRPGQRFEWYNKETGEAEKWKPGGVQGHRYVPTTIISTLQHNRLIPDTVSVDQLMEAL